MNRFLALLVSFCFVALGAVPPPVQPTLKTFNTIDDMVNSLPTVFGTNCLVLGRTTANDGGGGYFYTTPEIITTITNTGTIFRSTSNTNYLWKRIYSGPVNVKWFGAKGDGVTDDRIAFASAVSIAGNSTTVYVPKNVYLLSISGDSDTILLQSNSGIVAEPGTVLLWGYWGSPLLAAVGKSNIVLSGITFRWSGTWSNTTGANRDAFGFGANLVGYEYCSHILGLGTSGLRIENCSSEGQTTNNLFNNFINLHGSASGLQSVGNSVYNCTVNDCSIGIGVGEQKNLTISHIESGRYHTNSGGIYGPGHVIYLYPPTYGTNYNEYVVISDIIDNGIPLQGYLTASHSIKMRSTRYSYLNGLVSSRAEGAALFQDFEFSIVNGIKYDGTLSQADGNNACVFMTVPSAVNRYDQFNNIDIWLPSVNRTGISVNSTNTQTIGCVWQGIHISRENQNAFDTSLFTYQGVNGAVLNYVAENRANAAYKTVFFAWNTSTNNTFEIEYAGPSGQYSYSMSPDSTNNIVTRVATSDMLMLGGDPNVNASKQPIVLNRVVTNAIFNHKLTIGQKTYATNDYNISYNESLFNGTYDPSVFVGYNLLANGSQLNTNDISWGLGLEADYNDGSKHVAEAYLQLNTHAAVSTYFRPLFFQVNRDTYRVTASTIVAGLGGLNVAWDDFPTYTPILTISTNRMYLSGMAGGNTFFGVGSSAAQPGVLTIGYGGVDDVYKVYPDNGTGVGQYVATTRIMTMYAPAWGPTASIGVQDNVSGLTVQSGNAGIKAFAARAHAGQSVNIAEFQDSSSSSLVSITKDGDVSFDSIGKTLSLKTGSNAAAGSVTLTNGQATVFTTALDANSLVFTTIQAPSGTFGGIAVTNKVTSTSFELRSSSATDASVVAWFIVDTQ